MKVFMKKTIVNREEFLFIINEEKSILEDLMDLESGTVEENSYRFITDRNLLTEDEEKENLECQVNFLGGNDKDIHIVAEIILFSEATQISFLIIQSATSKVTGYDSFVQAEKILNNYKAIRKRK